MLSTMSVKASKSSTRGPTQNVADVERLVSVLAGAYFASKGVALLFGFGRTRSHPLLATVTGGIGASLLKRGATGHCAIYERIGLDSFDRQKLLEPLSFSRSITVNKPIGDVEEAFRSGFADYGREPLRFDAGSGIGEYSWTGNGQHWSFRLREEDSGQRTRISVIVDSTRGNSTPKRIAATLGKSLFEFYAGEDMRHLKQFLETGEIPMTEGQPHGARRKLTAAALDFATSLRQRASRILVTPSNILTELTGPAATAANLDTEVRL